MGKHINSIYCPCQTQEEEGSFVDWLFSSSSSIYIGESWELFEFETQREGKVVAQIYIYTHTTEWLEEMALFNWPNDWKATKSFSLSLSCSRGIVSSGQGDAGRTGARESIGRREAAPCRLFPYVYYAYLITFLLCPNPLPLSLSLPFDFLRFYLFYFCPWPGSSLSET